MKSLPAEAVSASLSEMFLRETLPIALKQARGRPAPRHHARKKKRPFFHGRPNRNVDVVPVTPAIEDRPSCGRRPLEEVRRLAKRQGPWLRGQSPDWELR